MSQTVSQNLPHSLRGPDENGGRLQVMTIAAAAAMNVGRVDGKRWLLVGKLDEYAEPIMNDDSQLPEQMPDEDQTVPEPVCLVSDHGFDYGSIDAKCRTDVMARTAVIRKKVESAGRDMFEIGANLISVKETIGHGKFCEWLEIEFEWGESTARRMMAVAEMCKSVTVTDLGFGTSVLYLLASDAVPEVVKQEAIAEAQAGNPPTAAAIKTRVKRAREKASPTMPVTPKPSAAATLATVETIIEQHHEPELTRPTTDPKDEFNLGVDDIIETLESARKKIKRLFDYDANGAGNKFRNIFAHHMGFQSTLVKIGNVIHDLEFGRPGAEQAAHPGFTSQGLERERERNQRGGGK